jgi:hypothetical protein
MNLIKKLKDPSFRNKCKRSLKTSKNISKSISENISKTRQK